MTAKIELPNLDDLVARYHSGVSVNQLSKEVGVARMTIVKAFLAAGVKVRGRSEAETVKWSVMKSDRTAVERQCAKAWQACAGRTKSDDELAKTALTVFRKQLRKFKLEDRVSIFLEAAGFRVLQQFPVGSYNIDVALDSLSIAVEVVHVGSATFNGCEQTGNRPQHERLKYLLDRGWHVIYLIGTGNPKVVDLASIGDDLVAAIKFASQYPSARGKYRVIWGQGKPSRAGYNFNSLPFVP